jgi:UDP-2-acetamido-3-amino-2,3-dideoxy-glucuronate N-acetyltransferase
MFRPRRSDTQFGPAVALFEFALHSDVRGDLCSIEFSCLPFAPQRIFFVQPANAGDRRGGHGHKTAHQLLICTAGKIDVLIVHTGLSETFHLHSPGKAIYLAPMVWSEQMYLSVDARLLVLSSESYSVVSYYDNPDGRIA